ncbi:MAG TPA: hypothetical protein VK612_11665, partial [Pyrinomonadaceae bacterium]|nr:hypothetical protein [Pyrinomonadaceae bacterium]
MSKFRSALKQIILSILGMFLSPVVAFAIGLPVIGLLFGMLYGIEFFKLKSVARSWMYVFGSWAIISGIYWIGFTLTSDFVTLRTRREVVSYFIKQLLVVLFFVAFVAFFISSFISK